MKHKETKSSAATKALIKKFFQLYPDEAARNLNSLETKEIMRLLKDEPIPIALNIFEQLDADIGAELIDKMEDEFFRQLFSEIDPSYGTALLARLNKKRVENRLSILPKNIAKEFQELMKYPPETAGNLMDPRVASFRADRTVEEVLIRIRAIHDRRITDVCVVNEKGVLSAVIPLQEIAISEPNVQLGDLIKTRPISIQSMAPRDEIVQLLEEQKLASLPVVDINGRLIGIIRYDTLVTAAKQEASEDIQAMFGAGRDERALSKATFAIRKRLPWLEINLATAFLAAAVVGIFEETIARITVLAVFLPVVAGQSGNTGSQALAVTMRGLALREIRLRHWLKIVRKEFMVGFFNGLAIALTTSLVAYVWTGSIGLPIIIGTAMIISMIIAGLSGAVIPILLQTFGQDPAQSSSIILTTVTDVAGFFSFLGLATILSRIFII